MRHHTFYTDYLKRTLDVFFAGLMLFFLWPLFIVIGIAIKLDSKGPAVFVQDRLTLGGRKKAQERIPSGMTRASQR